MLDILILDILIRAETGKISKMGNCLTKIKKIKNINPFPHVFAGKGFISKSSKLVLKLSFSPFLATFYSQKLNDD